MNTQPISISLNESQTNLNMSQLVSTNHHKSHPKIIADSPSLNEHNPTFMEATEGKWIKS